MLFFRQFLPQRMEEVVMSDDRLIAAEGRSLHIRAPEGDEAKSTLSPPKAAPRLEEGKRFQIVLPAQSVARLDKLQEMTEAATAAEVIRNAIRVYEALVKEIKDGKAILIKEHDGTLSQIRIF
jgi:hypothetical protein